MKQQQQMARALGWFSIGLGVAELLAPRRVGKSIGLQKKQNGLLRILGLREITSGIGILTQEKPAWMWSRVAGDGMDLAILLTALGSSRNKRGRVALAAAAVAGVAVADLICSAEMSGTDESPMIAGKRATEFQKSICINRPAEELFGFWRNFSNLPRVMEHLKSVDVLNNNLSHWVAKAPAGRTVEWDAEITAERPNELIAWRTLEGSTVAHEGNVKFERTRNTKETVVRVHIKYRPPGGVIGSKVAKLFGESPEQQIAVDLRRFKQLMETGEITTTEGQPSGRAQSATKYETHVKELAAV